MWPAINHDHIFLLKDFKHFQNLKNADFAHLVLCGLPNLLQNTDDLPCMRVNLLESKTEDISK